MSDLAPPNGEVPVVGAATHVTGSNTDNLILGGALTTPCSNRGQ